MSSESISVLLSYTMPHTSSPYVLRYCIHIELVDFRRLSATRCRFGSRMSSECIAVSATRVSTGLRCSTKLARTHRDQGIGLMSIMLLYLCIVQGVMLYRGGPFRYDYKTSNNFMIIIPLLIFVLVSIL